MTGPLLVDLPVSSGEASEPSVKGDHSPFASPLCRPLSTARETAIAAVDTSKSFSKVVDKKEVGADQLSLDPSLAPTEPVVRRDITGCDAFVLDNVLSRAECQRLIEQTEAVGYSFWDLESEKPCVEFRNSHTIECRHDELGALIYSRIKHLLLPVFIGGELEDDRWEMDIEGRWLPASMNQRMLFGRYLDGGHFAPHSDGTTVIDANERSFFSTVLFLDAANGGHTSLYRDEQREDGFRIDEAGRQTGWEKNLIEKVDPIPGRMLVFYHRIIHEGNAAEMKYIIRSDVMYHREHDILTSEDDKKAFDLYQEAQLLAEKGAVTEAMQMFRRCFKLSPALAKLYRQ